MSSLIVTTSEASKTIADRLLSELHDCTVTGVRDFDGSMFGSHEAIIFVGALGICVRSIAPFLKSKYTDPAVICVDSAARHCIAVASGHVGDANGLCRQIALSLGAEAVITTQTDLTGGWALDTIARDCGWTLEMANSSLNEAIFRLVNGRPTAFVAEINSEDVRRLRSCIPPNVTQFNSLEELLPRKDEFDLIISVTPRISARVLGSDSTPLVTYHPPTLCLGIGCRRGCASTGVVDNITSTLRNNSLSPDSIGAIATIELKKDEPLLNELHRRWPKARIDVFSESELSGVEVANPSDKVRETVGVWGVAESSAIASAVNGPLLIEKQKGSTGGEANDYTFAVAADRNSLPGGHVEIVGAGPGDPELVSVRGKRFLEQADLILYAGSLVPRELTLYAKQGCTVRSSADMTLGQQFELMKEFYDRGGLVVRLHTGDPCIYGAIQEQMAYFDEHGMSYHITPGISSFQAAAAELRSQFTIPERVQTIILTRGEGRTPMPEKEQLHKLAQSRSTMCIYLSAAVVEKVQEELLQAYPPETPVAACYKLTWKEQRIYRGELRDLARIVRDNNLTLTTLLVVGDAIDNRSGFSKLYDSSFSHLFRP